MRIIETGLPGVVSIEPVAHRDERGFFFESWRLDVLAEAGIEGPWLQDNHSGSIRNVLRGIHFQLERPQGKLVRATSGAIFDVAVDLRRSSPSFGRWTGLVLSAENRRQLWIPVGFGHGFLALSEFAEVQYKCTDYYVPGTERRLSWSDPDLAIDWPLSGKSSPLLAKADACAPRLRDAEVFP